MTKSQQYQAWHDQLQAAQITPEQMIDLLIKDGADPADAAEIVHFATGGTDVIHPEDDTP